MQMILRALHLQKAFDGIPAVHDVTFSVYPGEIYGLLGPNGAGKTTTIQMLLDVTSPDSGLVEIFGLDLRKHREEILSQMNFSSSYVHLPGNLTAEENLKVFGKIYGIRDVNTRITELFTQLDLLPYRKKLTGKLSSGQLTRLYLAKALINRPRLLLLDEPTASLDPDVADRTRSFFQRLVKEEGMTILYTSHNMAEVEMMCHRLAFLHQGKILVEGAPDEVVKKFQRRNLEDLFLHVARDMTKEGVEL